MNLKRSTVIRLKFLAIALFFISLTPNSGFSQEYVPACIGFYNVENLFDTIDNEDVKDSEFTPGSSKLWNSERYRDKLDKLAKVIGDLGSDVHPDGLIAVGLSEIENRGVIEDLINTKPLKERNYAIVHHDSPDKRGVDVGLIYQPKYFKVYNHKSYTLTIEGKDDFFTRDQLVVSGVLENDTIHLLVGHWPSRRGGEKKSRPLRMAAAELGRTIIDSLFALNEDANIMYMGDLNDDPTDPSVKRNLRTVAEQDKARNGRLFNPMAALHEKGIGSLAYRDTWNLFDQIILSPNLVDKSNGDYNYFGARVYNKPYLLQTDGNYAGYPFRTYVGDNYMGGYSDHFPVFVILVREAKPGEQ